MQETNTLEARNPGEETEIRDAGRDAGPRNLAIESCGVSGLSFFRNRICAKNGFLVIGCPVVGRVRDSGKG
jgi:hypothetical protein